MTDPVRSLGFRTDLMIRRLGGAIVTERPDYLVVRTPANPGFWWGNFLLFPRPLGPGDGPAWRAAFTREFPDRGQLAIGVDGSDGRVGDLAEVAALGAGVERSIVLTARQPLRPAGLQPGPEAGVAADVRRLSTEPDWLLAAELQAACSPYPDSAEHRAFQERALAEARRMAESGHGAWFGAFLGGRMRAGLGLFSDGGGLARYQNVQTHPGYRRRGLAGALLRAAARYGRQELGAHTLVIVADPDGPAINLYRSLGFSDTEFQVQLQTADDDE